MTTVTFHGTPVKLAGDQLVAKGQKLDGKAVFTNGSLEDVTLDSFTAKALVLNLFPSVDTGVCAFSVRQFNEKVSELPGAKVLCVSADLPFAQARFCGAEGLDKVENLSVFRSLKTVEDLGLLMTDGPLKGLVARAVVVLDANLTVQYVELSTEIGEHVNYEEAVKAVKELL